MWFLTILFINQIGCTKTPKKVKSISYYVNQRPPQLCLRKAKMLAKKDPDNFFLGSCTAPNCL